MDIDARAFGQLEGEVKALHAMLLEQNRTMAALSLQIENMSKAMSEARGGWKTVIWLAGVAASIGGLMTWFLSHIPFK